MEFKVRWLNSEEFDRLPYKKAPTSLGLADKNTQTVYVRDTGNKALDTFSVYHEIEHLNGNDHGEHEDPDEKGIFYKDTGGWLQTAAPLASFIPGVGPAVSLGMGAGGKAMQNRSAQKSQAGQQNPMQQFQTPQAPQAQDPNVVQTGGSGAGMMGGGGDGLMDKVRQMISKQRQSGFYAGRDAGGL